MSGEPAENMLHDIEHLKKLSIKEKFRMANQLLHGYRFAVCWQCRKIVPGTVVCESYKNYQEDCCLECAKFCDACNAYYCSEGEYKHEVCPKQCSECKKFHESFEEFPGDKIVCSNCFSSCNECGVNFLPKVESCECVKPKRQKVD